MLPARRRATVASERLVELSQEIIHSLSQPYSIDGHRVVIGASVGAFSVTTPSWRDEAQAERSHAITKASIPNHAARLFTKPNLAITAADANRGMRGLMSKSGHEKVLRGKRSSRLVLHGRQLGRA
jgi:predicted signal transduction protein with EAL and GGDEF domain